MYTTSGSELRTSFGMLADWLVSSSPGGGTVGTGGGPDKSSELAADECWLLSLAGRLEGLSAEKQFQTQVNIYKSLRLAS